MLLYVGVGLYNCAELIADLPLGKIVLEAGNCD